MDLQIKRLHSQTRCEICHKTDCFDLETLSCFRCEGVLDSHNPSSNTKPYLTKEQAIRLVENRFKELETQRVFINRKRITHLVVMFICLLPIDLLLLSFQSGKNQGSLLILNVLFIVVGLVATKRKAAKHLLNINQHNHLVSGLLELRKIARKYRSKANM